MFMTNMTVISVFFHKNVILDGIYNVSVIKLNIIKSKMK